MDDSTTELIRQIHASGTRLVLALTGGGSRAIGQLLEIPGGSNSVLEAVVPYSSAALDAYLGQPPEHYCVESTARLMAMASFQRGATYAAGFENVAGVGCTASLASDRPKRGAHRVHVAVQTITFTSSVSLELTKGARSRHDEEALVARLVLDAVAEACGVENRLPLELLPDESPCYARTDAPQPWQDLLCVRRQAVCHTGSSAPPRLLFPGAFHPLHEAHREMARLASQRLGDPVAYEISLENVDKPLLDYREIAERTKPFSGETLWLTRAPTFVEKARLFPGATFIVGVDTIRRMADAKYYASDPAARDRAIDDLAASGCLFLVFGRLDQGTFHSLDDIPMPPALRAICQSVPPKEFRRDISSTQLRQAKRDGLS